MRIDCQKLTSLMSRWTKETPAMWGTSIVGYGSYHYRYDSGREGDWCASGFAARKREIAVYLMAEGDNQNELLARLGPHKMGRACLTIKRLKDVDLKVLEKLVKGSLTELRRRHG